MPYATLNGLSFWFERAGAGPPLLFISGTGGDLRAQPNVFASPLAKAFDLVDPLAGLFGFGLAGLEVGFDLG